MMTFKTFALAAVASLALTSTASAFGFSYNDSEISGSTVELGQVTANGNAVVSLYEFHRGEQGKLLGTENISAGANYDVRVPLNKRPRNDVIAVLTVNGQVVDTQEIDSRW